MATTFFVVIAALTGGLAGCSDTCGAFSTLDSRCEKLCCDVADALESCIDQDPTTLTWDDLGARDRRDFARQCSNDWDRASSDLTAYELQEATAVCRDARAELKDLDFTGPGGCETVRALYAEP